MFYAAPTCPCNKKCRTFGSGIDEKTNQKAARRIIYPEPPEVDRRMIKSTLVMLENHDKVCDMYFRQNLSYFAIALALDIPAHSARNYLDRYVKGRARYE